MTIRERLRRLFGGAPKPTILEFLADGEWRWGSEINRACGTSYLDIAEHQEAGWVRFEETFDEIAATLWADGLENPPVLPLRRRYRITAAGGAQIAPVARWVR